MEYELSGDGNYYIVSQTIHFFRNDGRNVEAQVYYKKIPILNAEKNKKGEVIGSLDDNLDISMKDDPFSSSCHGISLTFNGKPITFKGFNVYIGGVRKKRDENFKVIDGFSANVQYLYKDPSLIEGGGVEYMDVQAKDITEGDIALFGCTSGESNCESTIPGAINHSALVNKNKLLTSKDDRNPIMYNQTIDDVTKLANYTVFLGYVRNRNINIVVNLAAYNINSLSIDGEISNDAAAQMRNIGDEKCREILPHKERKN